MLWVPTPSDEVAKLALPPLKVPLPIEVAPSMKETLPVGDPEAAIVAVKVTD
jgi:hypothetical protein